MATDISTVVQQPPEFIEAAAKPYLTQLQQVTGGLKEADLSQIYGPQYVAGLGALTQQAIGQAGGLGSYAPYLQAAQAATGPTAYQAYMSPYQQDVISSTLQEYDIQAQKGLPQLAAQAIGQGAFGGGREGVQRAEYQSASDRNRAALQAQLLQTGFGQAQQAAQTAFGQQQSLAQQQQNLATQQQQLAQLAPSLAGQQIASLTTLGGLGQAQQAAQTAFGQQQNLAAQQQQLASLAPQLAGSEIAGLTTLGGIQQAADQATLTAQQQLAQAQLQQPIQAAQTLGSGIMGLISGYPAQQQQTIQPTPSSLQTGLSAASTLAGIYKALNPSPLVIQRNNP